MTVRELDPRTPVVVGVGQFSERIDAPGYRGLSAVELSAHAARAAIEDCGADPVRVATSIDTVGGVRQFEDSRPGARSPLGRSTNYPRSVANRLHAQPRRAVLEVHGGQVPQALVTNFSAAIASGKADVALVFGGEALSTARHVVNSADRPDFSEDPGGQLEDRGYGIEGVISDEAIAYELVQAPAVYALFENARRARLGVSRQAYAAAMGTLFEPFTRVAAANPHAAAPVARSAAELVTPSERNRPIADPYTRFLVARDQVNLAASALLMSVGAAERLAVPRERWVFLHGHADLRERTLLERADLSCSPASVLASRHAREVAGVDVVDIATFDLYSCFPIPVFNICDGLSLRPDDPRGLTLTGGLPFFGGAGNNYSMHAIAETVQRLRAHPGAHGFVGANGGYMSKYSVGIYSTTPTAWREDGSRALQREVDSWPAVPSTAEADGAATIETYTVKCAGDGARGGMVVGRLASTDERFLARVEDGDAEMLDLLLLADEPIGMEITVRSGPNGNVAQVPSPHRAVV
ncbi:MAG: acetyl-CoA acetyltransferase [Actinobacteria bacterium]|nr:acetyl-CoA acetyltransferase [Actinomycetota bacterium]